MQAGSDTFKAGRTAGAGMLVALVFVFGIATPGRAATRAGELDEARFRAVMAAYVVNFAHHVRWPEGAFAEDEPLTIAVLNEHTLGDALDRAVAGRTVGGRPLRVVYGRRLEDLGEPQIVFMDRPTPAQTEEVARAVGGKPVLLVAFTTLPEGTDATVDLVLLRDGTLRYKLAVSRLRASGLVPTAGLLENALRGEQRAQLLAPEGSRP